MNNFSEKANFIWSVADLIRDTFKCGKYQDVILPFTVLRRIDCVLEPTKDAVVQAYETYGSKLSDPTNLLRSKSGYAFYNISPFTFERLLNDAPNLAANLRTYEEEEGTRLQAAILAALQTMSTELFKNRDAFEQELDRVLKPARIRLAPAIRKAVLNALAERDETADICRDKAGRPEPDPELRDTENIPLPEDGKEVEQQYAFDGYTMDLGKSIIAFFEREVKPYVSDVLLVK